MFSPYRLLNNFDGFAKKEGKCPLNTFELKIKSVDENMHFFESIAPNKQMQRGMTQT